MILNAIREAGLRPVTRRRFLALVTTAAVARARPTRGQARVPRVGMVSGGAPSHRAFLAGLRTVGHVPGETIVVEHRPTEGRAERYDGAIASTVGAGVDVLVVTSPHGIMAAHRRTSSVPVVAVDLESDPVAAGFVASLARPAGNITGVFLDIPEMSGKLLELLGEAVPGLARVGVRFRDVSAEQPDLAEVGAMIPGSMICWPRSAWRATAPSMRLAPSSGRRRAPSRGRAPPWTCRQTRRSLLARQCRGSPLIHEVAYGSLLQERRADPSTLGFRKPWRRSTRNACLSRSSGEHTARPWGRYGTRR